MIPTSYYSLTAFHDAICNDGVVLPLHTAVFGTVQIWATGTGLFGREISIGEKWACDNMNGFAEKTCLCFCCICWIVFILPSICSSPFLQLYYYHVQTARTNLLLVVQWKNYWMYRLWGLNGGTLFSPHLKAGVGDCLRKRWGNEIQQRMFSRQCPEIIVAWLWVSFTSCVFLPNSEYQHSKSWTGFSHSRSALLTDLLMKWSFVRKYVFTVPYVYFFVCLFKDLRLDIYTKSTVKMWCSPALVHDRGTEPGMLLISEADITITFTVAILSKIYCLRSTVLLGKDRNAVFLDSSTSDIFLPMQMGQDGKRPN